jgi:hypothetical protein
MGSSERSVAEGTVQAETRYARLGQDRIAYQALGQGPPDLVFTVGTFSHLDIIWEDPGMPFSSARWRRFAG